MTHLGLEQIQRIKVHGLVWRAQIGWKGSMRIDFFFFYSEFGRDPYYNQHDPLLVNGFHYMIIFSNWNNLNVPGPRKMLQTKETKDSTKKLQITIQVFDLFITCDVRSACLEKIEWISVHCQMNNADTSVEWNEVHGEWREYSRRMKATTQKAPNNCINAFESFECIERVSQVAQSVSCVSISHDTAFIFFLVIYFLDNSIWNTVCRLGSFKWRWFSFSSGSAHRLRSEVNRRVTPCLLVAPMTMAAAATLLLLSHSAYNSTCFALWLY